MCHVGVDNGIRNVITSHSFPGQSVHGDFLLSVMASNATRLGDFEERAFHEIMSVCEVESFELSRWMLVVYGTLNMKGASQTRMGEEGKSLTQLTETEVGAMLKRLGIAPNDFANLEVETYVMACAREMMAVQKYSRACAIIEAKIIEAMGGVRYIHREVKKKKRNPMFFTERDESFQLGRFLRNHSDSHQHFAPGGSAPPQSYWPITFQRLAYQSRVREEAMGVPPVINFYIGTLVIKRMLSRSLENFNMLMKRIGMDPAKVPFIRRPDVAMDAADYMFTSIIQKSIPLMRKSSKEWGSMFGAQADAEMRKGDRADPKLVQNSKLSSEFSALTSREAKMIARVTGKDHQNPNVMLHQDPDRPRATNLSSEDDPSPKDDVDASKRTISKLVEKYSDTFRNVCDTIDCSNNTTRRLASLPAERIKAMAKENRKALDAGADSADVLNMIRNGDGDKMAPEQKKKLRKMKRRRMMRRMRMGIDGQNQSKGGGEGGAMLMGGDSSDDDDDDMMDSEGDGMESDRAGGMFGEEAGGTKGRLGSSWNPYAAKVMDRKKQSRKAGGYDDDALNKMSKGLTSKIKAKSRHGRRRGR